MTREMTPAMIALWNQAELLNVPELYRNATRNPDGAIRSTFKTEREIPGTRAWAICECMCLANENFSDSDCATISNALKS